MKKIKKFHINIRESRVLSLLKYKEGTTQSAENFKQMITKEIHSAYEYIHPAAVYDTYQLKQISHLLENSSDIKNVLKNSFCVSIFAVTIGEDFEKQISLFQKSGDIIKASIWDAIGSEAVEQGANFINRLIREEASLDNCTLTQRFSPGYGDLDIKTNIKLIEFLDTKKVNISSTDKGLLCPLKSITALIGWEQIKKKKRKK